MKFPKQIFVTQELLDNENERYLAASKTMEEAFDGTQSVAVPVAVGIYKLDRVENVARELKSVTAEKK